MGETVKTCVVLCLENMHLVPMKGKGELGEDKLLSGINYVLGIVYKFK